MKKLKITRKNIVWASAAILLIGITILAIGFWLPSGKEVKKTITGTGAPFLKADTVWVNAELAKMSTEEKVGQLLMLCIGDASATDRTTLDQSIVSKVQPGGLCLGPGSLKLQLLQAEKIKSASKISPIIGASAEYGLLFPSDTLSRFPLLPGISAISDDSVIVQLAASVAFQLKQSGVQINFAPDMGLITKNIDDPREISYKMFLKEYARKAALYLRKQQEEGIFVCAGIFPNYQTNYKSNELIPFDSVRIRPFRDLVSQGLSGISVTHAPQLCSDSLHLKISDSLRKVLNFQGLVISDFSAYESWRGKEAPGMAEVEALKLGSDMLRISHNIEEVYSAILEAVKTEKISQTELDLKVKKILLAKSWAGLNKKTTGLTDSTYRALPWKEAEVAARKAIESSLVLLANKKNGLPISELSGMKAASVCLSEGRKPAFTTGLDHYASVTHFSLSPMATAASITAMEKTLAPYTTVVVAVFADVRWVTRAKEINDFLHHLESGKRLIVLHFGPPESLAFLDRYPLMIQSFGDESVSQSFAAQSIFGGVTLPGRLPLSCSQVFCYGDGCPVKQQTRVKYGIPAEVGLRGNIVARMDSLARLAINAGAFPGCQVFATCKGQVIVNKAWGFHKYDRKEEVRTGDLYDLASVTKVAASTIAMMSLYDAGKIKLDTSLNYYFKDLDKNSKGKKVRNSKLNDITLRQLMTHRSGLPAGLPLARFISPKWYLKYMLQLERRQLEAEGNDTLVGEEQSPEWMIDTTQLMMAEDSIFEWLFTHEKDNAHKLQIGEDFYMRSSVVDSIWELSKQTGVRKSKTYLYSDMNFYLVMKVVEMVTKMAIDKYVSEKFYRPLNLGHICYNPSRSFKKEQIIPTEEEKIFRKQLILGYVHDPTAALLGGVSGNAGLFSNAEDLGILMQMLLNNGTYGGRRYLSEKTIKLFTSVQEGGYRGLGWDHQTRSGMKMIAPGASPETFGHTGFTGTCVWVDPVNEIVFVFLSNRVHPRSTNQKINGMRVRQKMQQFIYDALGITGMEKDAAD